jgi:type IV pilus assembly protein PilC
LTAPTTTFQYRSIDRTGKTIKGKVDAPNEAAANAILRQQGIVPTDLSAGSVMQQDIKIPGLGSRVTLKDLSVLVRQLAAMTSSGMPLLRSLVVLEDQAVKPVIKKTLSEIRLDIEGGASLSAALAKHPKVFPLIMVAMIRAGETGGFLDAALDQIAINFEKDAALRGKIKSALMYPAIILAFSVVMVTGVLIFIVPVFVKMFKQFGGELPLPTQILATVSHNLLWLGPLLLVLGVTGVATLRHLLRTNPTVRLNFDRFKLRLPVFGPLFAKIALSRFSRNLGTLLSTGVPVIQALDVVAGTVGNAVIANVVHELKDAVRDGKPMSSPLREHKVFPQMVVQMIEVGEESGQISQMLGKVADFYDREVNSAAESLSAAIEPLMVMVMGVVVGGMVVCLYLPIFTIYQHIQGGE